MRLNGKHHCLLILLLYTALVSGQSSGYIADSLSIPVEIKTSRSYDNGVVTLGRSQFLSFPASFDDPARLLLKYPGISTPNDQANAVIYHALPSHMHQWQLYGARTLNPNHLSNAGTANDGPSRSAGGVNMMSGQVIGTMAFHGNPSDQSLNSLAGNSDVRLRNPYQNNVNLNLSLIGMEAGIDRVWGEKQPQNLMLNYRYSTVGLLTDLGLDFGGEVIKYQDLTAKYSIETASAGTFEIYGILGISSNNKDTISPVIEYADAQQVDYTKDNLVIGVAHTKALSDSAEVATTINYSRSAESRTSQDFFTDLDNFRDFDLDEQMISLTSYVHRRYTGYSLKLQLQSTYIDSRLASTISDKAFQPGVGFATLDNGANKDRLETILSSTYSQQMGSKSSIDVTVGMMHYHISALRAVGSASYTYRPNSNSSIIASYARSAQEVYPELLQQYRRPDRADPWLADHFRLSYQYKALTVATYYSAMHSLLGTVSGTVFSPLDELGNAPYVSNGPGISSPLFHPFFATTATVYGVDLSYQTEVAGVDVHPTLSLLKGEQLLAGVVSTPLPFSFGHIANIRLAKKWQLSERRYMGLGVSMHHRGGGYQSTVDPERSLDIGYTVYDGSAPYSQRLSSYYRVDLRWYYIVKKGSYKSTISLDIQNVTNRQNDAFLYYEPATGSSALQQQLGLLPVLSWRVSI